MFSVLTKRSPGRLFQRRFNDIMILFPPGQLPPRQPLDAHHRLHGAAEHVGRLSGHHAAARARAGGGGTRGAAAKRATRRAELHGGRAFGQLGHQVSGVESLMIVDRTDVDAN